jgi:monoamine oxidase
LDRYKIRYELVDGKMYRAKNGQLKESYDFGEAWGQLINKMKSLERDIPFQEFLNRYFAGERFQELRTSAIRFAEGFDLADIQSASTQGLISEWENEDAGQYRIPSGYETLVRCAENEFKTLGGEIFLNHRVEAVEWNSNNIRLTVSGKPVISLNKLIVSLPISLLNHSAPRAESIVFSPSLDVKKLAFNQIGFGTVVKIVMTWKAEFWKPLIPEAQFIFSDCFIPTWWTYYPTKFPVLTGWLGGPRAERLAEKPDAFFFEKALESLSSIFSMTEEELKMNLKDYRIFNWKREPWSRGAYTYPKLGFRSAGIISRKSVQGRIYFAGEACYEGPHPGTVEAAVVSGLDASRRLLEEA